MLAAALALVPGRAGAPGSIGYQPVDDDFPADDDTPLEETPGWEQEPDNPEADPEDPPVLVVRGHEVAQDRLVENGVAYKNPNAGPKDKKTNAALVEVAQEQGYIAPLVIDSNNFVGTTYKPSTGRLRADKKVDGVQTMLGEVEVELISGDEIGGVVRNDNYYVTHNGEAVAGPFPINAPTLTRQASGLIAKGGVTAAWIGSFSSYPMTYGYGSGYGFAWGGAV